MTTAIRVGIADDHAITRTALRHLLAEQPDMVIAGEAWNGRSAVEIARVRKLDVLLLDLLMPGQDGIDAMRMIRLKAPRTGILVLTSCPESHFAVDLLRRGAHGFLNKSCEPAEIVDAVRVVASGRRCFTPVVADLMASAIRSGPLRHPHENLNEREFQLLIHFARGHGSAEVAEHLSLSYGTVSNSRSALIRKLGVKNTSGLTHYAMVHGLLD